MRCTSAPASTRSAARRSAFGVVLVYWKRPVSVTTAMYSASAISGVSATPRSSKMSRSTSPVDEASATTRLTSPKRELSWWWSTLIVSGARSSTAGSGPSRCSFAQSSATSTRSGASGGSSRRRPSSGMNPYSRGSGASPYRYISLSLPRVSRASFIASSDPSASPSGFSWVTIRKRSWERSVSATALRSSLVPWRELIDQLRHADAALDRRIVLEGQLGSPLQPELARESSLQDTVRRGKAGEGLLALPFAAEDADENRRVAEVGRRLHAGDRDEPDPRILQLADALRDHLANGLVDASHPVAHAGIQALLIVERDDLALDEPELERLAGEVTLRAVEQLLELAAAARDARERQPRALPELVVVDFGHRGTEAPLQLRLHRQKLLPLALQGAVLGEVQLRGENADVAGTQKRSARRKSVPASRGRFAPPRASRRPRARRLPSRR